MESRLISGAVLPAKVSIGNVNRRVLRSRLDPGIVRRGDNANQMSSPSTGSQMSFVTTILFDGGQMTETFSGIDCTEGQHDIAPVDNKANCCPHDELNIRLLPD
jgi:hypothetical protein